MDSEIRCPALKRPKFEEDQISLQNQLRQFDVLDEVQGDGSEGEGSEDNAESSDTDLGEDEIESLLDERLPDELKNKRSESNYEERIKTILLEKGKNHFDVLPEGWVQVTHNSGMPLYLHKSTRVCTMARPYFLGTGSVRKHEIPLSAIPCLNYRKALEEEQTVKENLNGRIAAEEENQKLPLQIVTNAVIETVKENLEKYSLSAAQVTEYCRSLFYFKDIRVMRFKSWQARRRFTKNKKMIKNLQRPTLPGGTQIISFPIMTDETQSTSNRQPREWILNPNGKSPVCILHEYVQHRYKKQPTYQFKELETPATPYMATVYIGSTCYGDGTGTSKKQAKSEAARKALVVLFPELEKKLNLNSDKSGKQESYKDVSVFDEINIEDPRVTEFCAKTTEPLPHTILLTCLQRNFGLGDVKIDYQVNTTKNQKNEFTITVGKHTATVVCKNKRDGKHRASQAILQILHPHISKWGSLLRLYGNESVKSFKEKKLEEQEITGLQSKAAINQPNYAILDKLKLEMTKLAQSREAIKPIGIFVPPVNLPGASGSNLNNVAL